MPNELSEIVLHLAGETGQMGLAWTDGAVGMQASVDQHAAEVRQALAGHALTGPAGDARHAAGVRAGIPRGGRGPGLVAAAPPGRRTWRAG